MKVLSDELRRAAHLRSILRSDGEPAIVDLKRMAAAKVTVQNSLEFDFEESLKGDSKANGLAELAVKEAKAKIRTLWKSVERFHAIKFESDHVCLPYLCV